MMQNADRRLQIAGVKVTSTRRKIVIEELESYLVSRRDLLVGSGRGWLVMVVTPNPEQVVQAQADDTFRSILNESEYAVPDGIGLIIALRLLNLKTKNQKPKTKNGMVERISGVDLAEELVGFCAAKGLRVMLIGGRPGVAEEAVRRMKEILRQSSSSHLARSAQDDKAALKSLATLSIKGCSGARDIACETNNEREEVLRQIREFGPVLLLVAYGAPWQEKWVAANREELAKAGVKVAMVVGGAVDYWAGRVKRAPGVVRKMGLEWLWRLRSEPWRWKRQLRLIRFGELVVRELLLRSDL